MIVDTIFSPRMSVGYQGIRFSIERMEGVGDLKIFCFFLA
jgi:hypothetical protein